TPQDPLAINTQQLQVLEEPLVVAALLGDVILQIAGDAERHPVALELPGPLLRRLHERHRGAGDRVDDEQQLRIQRSDTWMRSEPTVGGRQCRSNQLDLATKTCALRQRNGRLARRDRQMMISEVPVSGT